jgi:hypothetical protein
LLDHCSILLGHAVHLAHRAIDLTEALGLPQCGAGDVTDQRADLANLAHDPAKLGPALADQLDPCADLLRAGGDKRLDALRRIGRALRERPHFGGDHGKAPARLTRTGSFNPGIEREQIGLEGDAVNHRNDLADFLR